MTTVTNGYRNNRLQSFNEKFNSITFQENWNLEKNSSEKLKFDFTIKDNFIYFNIHFMKIYPFYNFSQLPTDVSRFIYSFYKKDFITIQTKINFTDDYPFKAPIWHLLNVDHNLMLPICLKWYYSIIIENHNNLYKSDWSPAINIENDLLDFLQKINHFNNILECQ